MKYIALALGVFVSAVGVSSSASAQSSITGIINTIHPNLNSGRTLIEFVGKPSASGGSCTNSWVGNDFTDVNFKDYVLPILMTAKATKAPVTVWVQGCVGGLYPRIYSIDYEPRQ